MRKQKKWGEIILVLIMAARNISSVIYEGGDDKRLL